MMRHDPQEMVRYFGDFLTEINTIIVNIKQCVYELVDVYLPLSKAPPIQQTMSAVILATHRTYDDLKKIQSVLSGVNKSKRIIDQQRIITPNVKHRSKSNIQNPFYSPRAFPKIQIEPIGLSDANNQTRTIKRGVNSDRVEAKQQIQKHSISEEQTYRISKQKDKIKDYDCKTVKGLITERGVQYNSLEERPIRFTKNRLQQHLNSIIKNNRSALTDILQGNNECLRLVRSAKKSMRVK